MAIEEKKKDSPQEEPQEKDNWFEPSEIASAAYQSLDEQIKKLREIPDRVDHEAEQLFTILHDPERDILRTPKDIQAFRRAASTLNKDVGLTWHMLLKMDHAETKPAPPALQLPQLPSMTRNSSGSTMLPSVAGQPVVIKHGWGSAFWEHMTQRRMAKAFEHAVDAQKQPEITTSNVKDVRAYGEELQAEWAKTLDFHYKATLLIRHRNDEPTWRLLLGDLTEHCLKLANITSAFTTTLTEYRLDEFGDRKVGVAQGAMMLEAAKAGAGQQQSVGRDGLHGLWATRDKDQQQPH